MTDDEWRVCDNPARMRWMVGELRRSSVGHRWVLFDIACVRRVRDLLDTECVSRVDEVEEWVNNTRLHRINSRSSRLNGVRETIRNLWTRRSVPQRDARIAAARAVIAVGSHTLTTSNMVCVAAGRRVGQPGLNQAVADEQHVHAGLMRCVFRSTLHTVGFRPHWRTETAVALARTMCDAREFGAMPILADALQDAGCDDEHVLNHCRQPGDHVRGCFVADLVLGRE
jgi:hypothetical protein